MNSIVKQKVTAVFDIGKTNKKFFLFDSKYREVSKEYIQFDEIVDEDGFPTEDLQALQKWIESLFTAVLTSDKYIVEAVNFSTYGASFVHLDKHGKVLTPLYNYLKPLPQEIIDEFDQTYGDISKEIEYNHNSQMQMEVFSESIDDIQLHLNRLGFSLIESAFLIGDNWELVGGRYCSISGKIAAQLQIKNLDTSKIYTFYQAKLPDQFFNLIQDKQISVDGVNVKIWQENGLLMGLAK